MSNIWILAQADADQAPVTIGEEPVSDEGTAITKDPAGDPNSGAGAGGQKGFLNNPMNLIFVGLMIFIMIMMFRGPKKKQQEHQKMVKSLQKNDRIRTIGGIFGTIVDVRDDKILLKVDESNNTKMWISPNAVGVKVADENNETK
jgi:preprotein translocase subunit YajC